MKSASIFLPLLALAALTLAAQTASPPAGVMGGMWSAQSAGRQPALNAQAMSQPPVYFRCPITMRAQHLADGETIKTGKAKPQGIGQWLHLTFMAPDSRRIVKATLAVYGSSPKGRVARTATVRSDSSDASRALTAEFTAGADRNDVADLWVPGMTAVQSIEVLSVARGDGSTLKLSGDLACRVTPDGLMLITSR